MAFAGGAYGYEGPAPQTLVDWLALIPQGWVFVLCMIGILGAHELGHFIAAKIHREPASPPFFIPFPLSLFGTMGAVIALKAPPVNRRVMLDIGVAGPLAGLAVCIPVLLYGLATSPVQALAPDQVTGFEGNSILYVLLKYAVTGRFLPEPASFGDLPPWLYMLRFYTLGVFTPGGGTDVYLNDIAWAGWGGLLITGLNLIPVGQLDGGHAVNVLFGQRGQRLIWPVAIGVLLLLGFVWQGWWLWAGLLFLFGRQRLEPLDMITDIGPGRRALAWLMPVLFVLLFMPVPLQM
jgi:membrane-associated protease RseP (regulator of RpoE activity)